MAKTELSIERLRALLDYDPQTGMLTWRVRRRGARQAGDLAGYIGKRGYLKIHLDGKYWLGHRLAWALATGGLPPADLVIDHINRITHDNRFSNLRVVTHRENNRNTERRAALPSSLGTTFHRSKWQAQIAISGKTIYLGTFARREDAHRAYLTAARTHGILPAESAS